MLFFGLVFVLFYLLIQICWIWWWCSFVLFWTGNTLLMDKFGPKNQNCLFNMISRLIPICSPFLFWNENILFVQILSRNQNCFFKMKFGPYTNSNMLKLMVMFTFSLLYRKYHLWTNLVQKNKTVSLRWNAVPRPIQIC